MVYSLYARSILLVLLIVAAVCVASFVAQGVAIAQTGSGDWSPPTLLFKIPDDADGDISVPVVVAGQDGSVHVFWQYQVPEDARDPSHAAIYYTQWNGKTWSQPLDIVDAPTLHISSATIDRNGYLHLMWQSYLGRLYYSRAWEGDATSAGKWTRPVPVDMAYADGQIVADSSGWVHRVYARPGHLGPYYQVSKDGGSTWSFPVNVARTSGEQTAADWVRLAVSDKGTLHVVWTEFALPNGWPPTGVFYSRSEDGGATWSPSTELAGPGYDQINVAVAGDSTVHVAWNGMSTVTSRYHRWSADAGKTWSATSLVVQGGGTEGPPQLDVDSAGNLHLLTTSDGRVWYASYQGGGWTVPQYVPSGDESAIPPVGKPVEFQTRQIEQAAMAIGRGNQLHAVFWDIRRKDMVDYVWYTTKVAAAPALSPVSFPIPTPTATTSGEPASAGVSSERPGALKLLPTGVPSIPAAVGTPPDPATWQPSPDTRSPAFTGGGLAALLLGSVIILGVIQRRSR